MRIARNASERKNLTRSQLHYVIDGNCYFATCVCNSTHQQLQLRSKDDKFVAFYREFEYDHESYRFFKPLTCLPTAQEAGLSARKTEEANKAVEEVLASQRSASAKENKKRKCTSFTPEIRVICLLKTAMELKAG